MDIYKERIRLLFDKSGMADKDLEETLELPRGVIYKWGTGKYKSYKNYIPQIASYFHVSTDYLLGNTDDPRPAAELTGEGQKNTAHQTVSGESDLDVVLRKLPNLKPADLAIVVKAISECMETE